MEQCSLDFDVFFFHVRTGHLVFWWGAGLGFFLLNSSTLEKNQTKRTYLFFVTIKIVIFLYILLRMFNLCCIQLDRHVSIF